MILPRITVLAVAGVDYHGHQQAVHQTQGLLPARSISSVIWVPGMTRDDYSYFMAKMLWTCFATEFVLVVQADGYAVNPDKWSDEFLQYDYVGAPFPNGEIGNGGFSLRSRQFTVASMLLPDPDIPEDAFLCQKHHEGMCRSGIRYAPFEVARRFSFEHSVNGSTKEEAFGFHGEWNK